MNAACCTVSAVPDQTYRYGGAAAGACANQMEKRGNE